MISNYKTYSTPAKKNYQHNFINFLQTADLNIKSSTKFNQQEKFKRRGVISRISPLPLVVTKTPGLSNFTFLINRVREAGFTIHAFAYHVIIFIFHITYVIIYHIKKYGSHVNKSLLTMRMRDSVYKLYNECNKYYGYIDQIVINAIKTKKSNNTRSCNQRIAKRCYYKKQYAQLIAHSIDVINNYISNITKRYKNIHTYIALRKEVLCA